ncbi:MAG TPA: FAD-dependent oxidoreductase [Solirubrobacteraceae bacterium]|nr:FAD-dependent oxidoreductase [Solirubrobacteraceae bacterium]
MPGSIAGDDPVVVVGGGVVGLCVAHYLAAAGVAVVVLERAAAGSGASWGNAGWVCRSHSAPIAAPGAAAYALRSLGRPDSPLWVRPSLDPALAGWALRFWRSSRRARFRRGYAALVELNRPTLDLFDGLRAAGVETTLRTPGLVHAFLSAGEARRHLSLQRAMAGSAYEVPDDIAVGDDVAALDAALGPRVEAAYRVAGEGVVDPGRLVRSLAASVPVREGVAVVGVRQSGGRVRAVRTSSGELPCSAVVVAAGTWSAGLLRSLGHRLPLQAAKGYSFSVRLSSAPSHPLYLGDRRVVASPMNGAVRIAGTMELSGNNRRLDWRRLVAVASASRHYLGDWYEHPDDLIGLIRDPWVGGRPLLPDSLPVIDRLPGAANAFVATGHGMLGVTLAPASGCALSEYMLSGRRPDVLEPFRFDRF